MFSCICGCDFHVFLVFLVFLVFAVHAWAPGDSAQRQGKSSSIVVYTMLVYTMLYGLISFIKLLLLAAGLVVHVPSAWVQYIFVAREGGGVCGFTLLRDILKKNKRINAK